eukprot:1032511-Amphidinium_carterae.1
MTVSLAAIHHPSGMSGVGGSIKIAARLIASLNGTLHAQIESHMNPWPFWSLLLTLQADIVHIIIEVPGAHE